MPSTPETESAVTRSAATLDTVMQIIQQNGKITALAPAQDFYDAGLTSLASLTLLLDLEEKFNISIPDDRFIECRTAEAVAKLIAEVQS